MIVKSYFELFKTKFIFNVKLIDHVVFAFTTNTPAVADSKHELIHFGNKIKQEVTSWGRKIKKMQIRGVKTKRWERKRERERGECVFMEGRKRERNEIMEREGTYGRATSDLKNSFLKVGHSRTLFLYFCLFNTVVSKHMFHLKVCWWLDLWYRKLLSLCEWNKKLFRRTMDHTLIVSHR